MRVSLLFVYLHLYTKQPEKWPPFNQQPRSIENLDFFVCENSRSLAQGRSFGFRLFIWLLCEEDNDSESDIDMDAIRSIITKNVVLTPTS